MADRLPSPVTGAEVQVPRGLLPLSPPPPPPPTLPPPTPSLLSTDLSSPPPPPARHSTLALRLPPIEEPDLRREGWRETTEPCRWKAGESAPEGLLAPAATAEGDAAGPQ